MDDMCKQAGNFYGKSSGAFDGVLGWKDIFLKYIFYFNVPTLKWQKKWIEKVSCKPPTNLSFCH